MLRGILRRCSDCGAGGGNAGWCRRWAPLLPLPMLTDAPSSHGTLPPSVPTPAAHRGPPLRPYPCRAHPPHPTPHPLPGVQQLLCGAQASERQGLQKPMEREAVHELRDHLEPGRQRGQEHVLPPSVHDLGLAAPTCVCRPLASATTQHKSLTCAADGYRTCSPCPTLHFLGNFAPSRDGTKISHSEGNFF